jgi:hypothetical protein
MPACLKVEMDILLTSDGCSGGVGGRSPSYHGNFHGEKRRNAGRRGGK